MRASGKLGWGAAHRDREGRQPMRGSRGGRGRAGEAMPGAEVVSWELVLRTLFWFSNEKKTALPLDLIVTNAGNCATPEGTICNAHWRARPGAAKRAVPAVPAVRDGHRKTATRHTHQATRATMEGKRVENNTLLGIRVTPYQCTIREMRTVSSRRPRSAAAAAPGRP